MSDSSQYQRRQLLAQVVRFLFFIGLLAFIWVIISNIASRQPGMKGEDGHFFMIDVSAIKVGEIKKITHQYKEIWVYHRSREDINILANQSLPLRSQRDEYFVFYPYEPDRQCQVNWNASIKQFYDTCHARYFDLAGRVVNSKSSQSLELPVPLYRFIDDMTIQLDARQANFR